MTLNFLDAQERSTRQNLLKKFTKALDIVEVTGKSYSKHSILHDELGMRKLAASWVPRLVTVDHKHDHVSDSKACFAMCKRDPKQLFVD